MPDPPPDPDPDPDRDTGEDTELASDREAFTSAPRWVKVFGIVAFVLILLLVILLLTGRGHGPGRHTQSGALGGHALLSGVEKQGEHRP